MLDRLLKISSLSGAVLIFCGVLKLIVYYYAFNIRIVEFLSFSEIITSFLDDINLLLIYVLVMLIQTIPLMNYLHRKSNLDIETFYNNLLVIVYGKKYRFIVLFVILSLILGLLLLFDVLSLNYVVIYVLIFCLIQTLTYLSMSKASDGKVEITDANAIILFPIIISASILLLAQRDIIETKKGRVTASIQTSAELIDCDNDSGNLYLGKTDNFIFVKRKSGYTECIPISEVRKLKFR